MTYPQQQYPPQVQHIDPRYAQQYGAPQGTPWMPQQYGGAPAGTPPQPAAPAQLGGQGLPTSPPALGQSQRTGEGGPKTPAPRHLVGRTVIFEPIRIDETTTVKVKNPATGVEEIVPRPTAYYHLTVVDGGPLQYGDNRDHDISKQHGMTHEVQTPCRFTNVSSDRFGIVNEIRDAMARGDVASVGVIVQGTKGNRPFLVTKTGRDLDGNERPDGAARYEAATLVWNAVFGKTFQNPEPRSLVVAPAQQPPQVAYQPAAPAGYAQQQYAQTGTVPTPYGAQSAAQLHPEYVAAATQPTYGQQAYPQGYMTPDGPVVYGSAPQPGPGVSMLAQAVQQSAPPVNPAFEAWLTTLPPEQQAAQRAAMAGLTYGGQPVGPGI